MKIGTLALAAFMAFTSGAAALAQSDFYRGKQLKIIVGSEAGGGFSSYSLLLSAYLGKNIPGNPAVSIQHLPGSGGVNAIDYLANAAPKDGTVIAVANGAVEVGQLFLVGNDTFGHGLEQTFARLLVDHHACTPSVAIRSPT